MASKCDTKEVVWSHPASDHLWKMFNGYRYTLAVIPACELKIFDKVAAHPDGISAARLAEQHSWQPENTARLLDAQAAIGLLKKKSGPDNIGIYQITDIGRQMLSDFRGNFDGVFTLFSKMYLKSMSSVTEQITSAKEGDKAKWVLPDLQVHGGAKKQGDQCGAEQNKSGGMVKQAQKPPCSGCQKDPSKENELRMYQIMESFMYPYLDDIVHAFDLKAYKSVVDIGGGTGLLSYALSRTYPHMKVTLYEMPPVLKVAKEHFKPDDFDKLSVDFVAGDCLKDEIPAADLYVCCKVVHHFPEKKIEEVFHKFYQKLPRGGAVLLLEDILTPMRDGPGAAHCFDLMTMSRQVGKNRTLEEYLAIFERCNFNRFRCIRTNEECVYDLILAIKD